MTVPEKARYFFFFGGDPFFLVRSWACAVGFSGPKVCAAWKLLVVYAA